MKKVIVITILFIFSINLKLNSTTAVSPERLLIIGGVVGGIELIHIGINIFRHKKVDNILIKNNKDNKIVHINSIDKKKELKKLLAPSKLLSLIEESSNTNSSFTNINQVAVESNAVSTNQIVINNYTNNNKYITNITYQTEKYNIKPVSKRKYFTYTITNKLTKESYEYKSGAIDYYEVGIAYFSVGKKEKAKEYLLHTIAINERKKEAINFLLKHYKITLQEIRNQARKYKILKKNK